MARRSGEAQAGIFRLKAASDAPVVFTPLLAETTGKRVIVDPRVKGQVTILSRDPMSPEEALQVVVAAINVYGAVSLCPNCHPQPAIAAVTVRTRLA